MPDTATPVLVLVFLVCAALSLTASAALIARIERLGEHVGVTEAVLGLVAALAADAPEITTAVTALVRGQEDVGVGIVLGANVFQLASLLGLGALAAGGIRLDRGVVVLEGVPALWLALVALAVVRGGVPGSPALLLALVVFVPYVVVSALGPAARARLPLPARFRTGVTEALAEEESEIAEALAPLPRWHVDAGTAAAALVLVVAASVVLETTASELGARAGVPDVVLGGVVLAAVTSLPNLVAAIYLARRGRGAATLSEAMNSNRINTLAGLLLPAALLGTVVTATLAAGTVTLAVWYVVMTAGSLTVAYARRGLGRVAGTAILATYLLVVITLVR